MLVGLDRADDAGVYKVTDDIAMIQTVDFFTPIVDDPYSFGQIAASNALSDIYAMGGTPLTAMNIICFPIKEMDISVLQEILQIAGSNREQGSSSLRELSLLFRHAASFASTFFWPSFLISFCFLTPFLRWFQQL